jgi:DNA (cytosine-5)-methyltransferase 1
VQAWKRPGVDMGRYRQQYTYRCPHTACRNRVVEPEYLPAWTVIDWALPGTRIGDRARPLAAKTLARIEAGIARYARPVTVEAAGNTHDAATRGGGYYRVWPVEEPLRTLHTTASKAVAVPPLLVPVEGRGGVSARAVDAPGRTQTGRCETALVVAPFVAELRGGGSTARPLTQALATVTASGTHHGLVVPTTPATPAVPGVAGVADAWRAWAALYAYDTGLRPLTGVLPTQTTIEGDALLTGDGLPAAADCLFRMLEPAEIGAGMAFAADYQVLGNRRERIRQYGNAVTPPVAEVLVAALVEAITGEDLEPAA